MATMDQKLRSRGTESSTQQLGYKIDFQCGTPEFYWQSFGPIFPLRIISILASIFGILKH